MQKEVFKTLIKEGQDEIQEIELYQRPLDFEERGRYVLVGIRRAGLETLHLNSQKRRLPKSIIFLTTDY